MTELDYRHTIKLALASASVIWYAFLWSLGLLGCIAAYVSLCFMINLPY